MDKYFINPAYLQTRILYDAAKRFAQEGSIQLHQFLIPEAAQKIITALQRAPLALHEMPDRYRCHEPKAVPLPGKELQRVLATAHEIRKVISTIVGKPVRFQDACWCVYAHKDYTLLHDKNKEPPGYDVILDLTPRWDNRACGYHSYVDGKGSELVRVAPAANALTIVRRPKDVMKFVKYVNHHAGTDKRFVLGARFA